jgi:hypothetical protein
MIQPYQLYQLTALYHRQRALERALPSFSCLLIALAGTKIHPKLPVVLALRYKIKKI